MNEFTPDLHKIRFLFNCITNLLLSTVIREFQVDILYSYTELSWHVWWSQRFPQIQASICINVEIDQGIASYGIITDKGIRDTCL